MCTTINIFTYVCIIHNSSPAHLGVNLAWWGGIAIPFWCFARSLWSDRGTLAMSGCVLDSGVRDRSREVFKFLKGIRLLLHRNLIIGTAPTLEVVRMKMGLEFNVTADAPESLHAYNQISCSNSNALSVPLCTDWDYSPDTEEPPTEYPTSSPPTGMPTKKPVTKVPTRKLVTHRCESIDVADHVNFKEGSQLRKQHWSVETTYFSREANTLL